MQEEYFFENFDSLSQSFLDLKRKKKLHPITEKRLALLLKEIYPEAYPKPEPGEIPGGRSDLAFYFDDGRYVVFEVFATVSQVAQDLRHLEQSNAQARIAILTDPALDNGAIYDEYYTKRPRDPFPTVKLSEILVVENEVAAKKKLKQLIDKAFSSDSISIEPPVDVTSRLEEFGLKDTSDPNFGATKLTNNLYRPVMDSQWGIDSLFGPSSTIFLSIPTTSVKSGSNTNFKVAREIFDPTRWYNWKQVEQTSPGSRLYAYRMLPLLKGQIRTEQKEIVVEHKLRNLEPGIELVEFVLRVNEFGEVSFAKAVGTVHQFKEEGARFFRLGAMIHLFWSFLCLVREFQEGLGYTGNNHVCLAMVNTQGSYLGHFAKGQPNDPFSAKKNPYVGREEICQVSNLLIRRDIDLSTFEEKIEPDIIYDVAEEIARAFNQPEARCFDRETRKLPDYLWPG